MAPNTTSHRTRVKGQGWLHRQASDLLSRRQRWCWLGGGCVSSERKADPTKADPC